MTQAPSAQHIALRRLTRAMEQREFLETDPIAQRALTRRIGPALDDLAASSVPQTPHSALETPPRRVAVAMALALYTQPHLSTTFQMGEGPKDDLGNTAPRRPDPSLVVSNDVLQEALGLSKWELDDLREEVDRRAGGVLKQRTLLNWLWSRFGLPGPGKEALFRVLFPGRSTHQSDLVRRGGQLYAVSPQDAAPPLDALFIGTSEAIPQDGSPSHAFRSRYVDPSLLRSMARGIGLEAEQATELLERTVTVVPKDRATDFLAQDHWRSGGYAQVTTLGTPYSLGGWLGRPLGHSDLQWHEWMTIADGALQLRRPIRVFDAFMAQRAHAILTQRYTAILAETLTSTRPGGREAEALIRYQFHRDLERLAQPLLDWALNPATHRPISQFLQIPLASVAQELENCHTLWVDRLHTWTRPEGVERLHGTISQLMCRLSIFDGSLRRLYHQEADPRWAHQDILLLFAGHYVAEAPFDRTLLSAAIDSEHPGQALGEWFWPTWLRLLNALEDEASTTNSGFISFSP